MTVTASPAVSPTTASTASSTTSRGGGRLAPLWRRWPTVLALVMSAVTLGGGDNSDGGVGGLAEAFLLLPLAYLVVGQLGRRRATWPVVGAGLGLVVGLRAADIVPPATVLVGVALAVLVWGAVAGHPHGRGVFTAQALGWLGFAALAVAGMAIDPELGRYLVAAAWFLHGVWDYVHLRLDKVVSRSFAEWCAMVDILIAVQLVVLV